jgi:hypothetical protein
MNIETSEGSRFTKNILGKCINPNPDMLFILFWICREVLNKIPSWNQYYLKRTGLADLYADIEEKNNFSF